MLYANLIIFLIEHGTNHHQQGMQKGRGQGLLLHSKNRYETWTRRPIVTLTRGTVSPLGLNTIRWVPELRWPPKDGQLHSPDVWVGVPQPAVSDPHCHLHQPLPLIHLEYHPWNP